MYRRNYRYSKSKGVLSSAERVLISALVLFVIMQIGTKLHAFASKELGSVNGVVSVSQADLPDWQL